MRPMRSYAFLDTDRPLAIAHRGGTDQFPENTLAAFAHAIALGYTHVETDVHLTSDGHLVAFHDPQLAGVTNDGRGDITSLTLAEVQAASIIDDEGRAHKIPRLAEILTTWPDIKVNIDPKSDAAVEPLITLVRDCGAIDRVCIGSFSDARIWRCRRALGPDLCTSMGPIEMARLRAGSVLQRAPWNRTPLDRWPGVGRYRAGCAQVPEFYKGHKLIDDRFMEYAAKVGLAVHVWTVNDESDMGRFLDLGADGLITDRLRTLKSVFARRNIWHR